MKHRIASIVLMMSLAIVSLSVCSQLAPPSLKPWNEVQTYALDLVWKEDDMLKAVFDALPEYMKIETDNGKIISNTSFASIDLNGDGKDELIVWSHEFFSGGPGFAILQKWGDRWRVIGEIQGGFSVSRRSKKGHVDIETWSRHPEIYHRLWKFSGGRYKVVRQEVGPWKDRAQDIPYAPKRNRN